MPSFNKVVLVGNLTADPELKRTASGLSVCTFSIAVQRRLSKNDQQGQPTADFFNIVAWSATAEFVTRFFKKGTPILVCGRLQNRNWTDQQNVKHYVTEVVAEEATFVAPASGRAGDVAPAGGNQTYTPDAYAAPTFQNGGNSGFEELPGDDGLPF